MIELLMGILVGIGSTLCVIRLVEDRREKKFLREHGVTEEAIRDMVEARFGIGEER